VPGYKTEMLINAGRAYDVIHTTYSPQWTKRENKQTDRQTDAEKR